MVTSVIAEYKLVVQLEYSVVCKKLKKNEKKLKQEFEEKI